MSSDKQPMNTLEQLAQWQAEINGPGSWARRWQIEREDNERLNAVANMVRTGVHGLLATCNKSGLRSEVWRAGYAAALRDVIELMEHAESGKGEG
jgi:hypothetical protein